MSSGSELSWLARGNRGFVCVRGAERVELLHRLSTRNLEPLAKPGHVEWTIFTTSQGKLVDWVAVFSLEDALILRVSEGRDTEMVQWLERYIIMEDVQAEVVSEQWTDLIVCGSEAHRVLGLSERPVLGSCSDVGGMLVASGLEAYEDRLELLVPVAQTDAVEERLNEAGYQRVEAAVLETARVSAGVPSSAYEYAKPINPLELRMVASSISWNKGCYIGQEVISRLDSYDKVARMLMGVRAQGASGIAPGDRIELEGKKIGKVTSWLADVSMGLAIVERDACKPGSCEVVGADGCHIGELVDCAFWG